MEAFPTQGDLDLCYLGEGRNELEDAPRMKELNSLEDLERCLAVSAERPVFIYKHSSVCPISARADREVTQFLNKAGANCPETYRVKVIEKRPVSREVAAALSLQHESPQLILVKNGRAVWSASHAKITA